MAIGMIFLVLALVCWLIAAIRFNTEKPWVINIGWLGMFFYGLSLVIR